MVQATREVSYKLPFWSDDAFLDELENSIKRPEDVETLPIQTEPTAEVQELLAVEALTYRQHIARLHSIYPTSRVFRELHGFFESAGEQPRATQVTIADCIHGDYSLRSACTVQDLRDCLSPHRSKESIRIILLEYQTKRSLDREILGLLGTTFAINPVFFYKHITLNRFGSDAPFFASEQDGMEVKLQRNFASSLVCYENAPSAASGGGLRTVILLAQTQAVEPIDQGRWLRMHGLDFSPDREFYNEENGTIAAYFRSWISLLSPAQMEELNRFPIWSLLPICKLILLGFARKLENVEDMIRACEIEQLGNVWNIGRFQYDLAYLRKLKKDLHKTSESIQGTQRRCPVRISESVLMDCEELITRAQQLQDDFQDLLNRYVGLASLQESKKSIEQAESVRQLNHLAFLFLPLSFATSILGMNVKEFGQGSLPIWVFFPIATVVSLMVFLLYVYYHNAWDWLRKRLVKVLY